MIGFLKELACLESPTSDKKAVDACSSFLVEKFRKVGAKTIRFPKKDYGDFYLAEYPPRNVRGLDGQILILTHVDTVWPVGKIETMPFFVSGARIFGPGVLDMKAGLALTYFSLKTLHELNIRPQKKITVFINSAEEIGCDDAHKMIQKLASKSDRVLCLEPALPGGALKVQRKGRLVVRLDAWGKTAHAGAPEKGVNAIEELMAQLRLARKIKSRDISLSIGMINGGEKANIVPDRAWAVCDIRFWNTAQKEKILNFFKKMTPHIRGAKVKSSVESLTPPMEKTKASTALLSEVRKTALDLGITLGAGKTGGGSDASIAAGLGVATIDGLGPDGDGIHAENEHLLLPSYVQRAALLVELLRRL